MGAEGKIYLVLFFCIFSMVSWAQERIPAFEMNGKLGRGVNMGNCFEAPTETEWGNPWKPEYFKIIAEQGFNHVRLPVRWETEERSMSSAPYTINPTFLNRIKEVVDTALKYDLHIIVNMHHHELLFENPEVEKERFLSQWYQIADFFKDYPDHLLFEILNEPHGNISPEMWNRYFEDALTEIRKTNPTRVVLLGVADYGGLGGIVHLELPDDDYIILSPHYYNPFNFTHQGAEWVGEQADEWLGTEWLDTEAERETVVNEFNYAMQFSEENKIPIHVGEFGAYSKAGIASRERWTTFLARWFEEQDFSWAYWEFSAGFGIYNPLTKELLMPLVDALQHNEMPEPTPVFATPIYTSDFSGSTDGWVLNTNAASGAEGTISISGGKLNVTISNGGTESWHAQLMKNNIRLEKDVLYRISFKAQANENRSATYYAGKASDPWNAYSGYNGISIGTTEADYTSTFTMTSPTDPVARLVFDLGKSTAGISITEVKVERLEFEEEEEVVTATDLFQVDAGLLFYPNPVSSTLYIEHFEAYQLAELYDMQGRSVASYDMKESLDISGLPKGIYLLKLSGNGSVNCLKVIKD